MICLYDRANASLRDSKVIYGKSYGVAWICDNYPKCDSYVGCHPGTDMPLGRLANKELRAAKMKAHRAFDPLWRSKRGWTRTAAYAWLASGLGINEKVCHIGMFDVETCEKVVKLCEAAAAKIGAIQ